MCFMSSSLDVVDSSNEFLSQDFADVFKVDGISWLREERVVNTRVV